MPRTLALCSTNEIALKQQQKKFVDLKVFQTPMDTSVDAPKPLLVVALGGNALLQRGEAMDFKTMDRNASRIAEQIAQVAVDYRVVITHGNGPQVGLLLEGEAEEEGGGGGGHSLDLGLVSLKRCQSGLSSSPAAKRRARLGAF